MDIGTGKDLADYGEVPYHLIDIAEPGTRFSLHQWLTAAREAIADIAGRGRRPIVCGGTGLYIEALVADYSLDDVAPDLDLRNRLEAMSLSELQRLLADHGLTMAPGEELNPRRIVRALERHLTSPDTPRPSRQPSSQPILLVDIPRDMRRARIADRLQARLSDGMVDEIDALLRSGITAETLIAYGLEYRYITLYLTGKLAYDDMVRDLQTAICQFSKRQMTYFRGMQRRGLTLVATPYNQPIDTALLNL